jgi:hypothetical protein
MRMSLSASGNRGFRLQAEDLPAKAGSHVDLWCFRYRLSEAGVVVFRSAPRLYLSNQ